MKFLLVCTAHQPTWLLRRLEAEGHDVVAVSGSELAWLREVSKDRLVVFLGAGRGHLADAMRSDGFRVIGAGKWHDLVESNEYGDQIMALTECRPAHRAVFQTCQEASKHLEGMDGRFRLRCRNGPVVADAHVLSRLLAVNADPGLPILLDEVPDAPVWWVGAWFNGADFLLPAFAWAEEPGALGMATFRHWRPPIFQGGLAPLRNALRRVDFRGMIALEVAGGEVGLRWCAHIDTLPFALLVSLLESNEEVARFLSDIASGANRSLRSQYAYAVGLHLRAPTEHPLGEDGHTWPLDLPDTSRIAMLDAQEAPQGFLVERGALLGLALGKAPKLHEARDAAYDVAHAVEAELPGLAIAGRRWVTAHHALRESLRRADSAYRPE